MGEAKRRRMNMADAFASAVTLLPAQSVGIPQQDLSDPDRVTMAGITLGMPGIGTAVRRMFEDLTGRIYEAHGIEAFTCRKHAAAIHEAGHLVVYAAHGKDVTLAHIQPSPSGVSWIGYSEANGVEFHAKDGVGESAEVYLQRVRFLLAGVLSERLFDPDARAGSSLDEIVMAQVLASRAAHLTGNIRDDSRYFEDAKRVTGQILVANGQVVREIALHLHDCHRLESAQMRRWSSRIRRIC